MVPIDLNNDTVFVLQHADLWALVTKPKHNLFSYFSSSLSQYYDDISSNQMQQWDCQGHVKPDDKFQCVLARQTLPFMIVIALSMQTLPISIAFYTVVDSV